MALMHVVLSIHLFYIIAQTTMMEVSMSKLEQASEELRASVAERRKLLEEKAAEIKGMALLLH